MTLDFDDAVEDDQAEADEALLSFFYQAPVGLLRLDPDGAVQMLNPLAAQLLMPICRRGGIANLFDVLEGFAPDLRHIVALFAPAHGRICANRRIVLGDPAHRKPGHPTVLACTLLKVNARCLMATLDDVSDQVALERRLKHADSWMAAIFSTVKDFVCFSIDASGLITCWNQSGLAQTGYTEAHVIGRTLDMFYPLTEQSPEQTREHVACARREGWHLHESPLLTRDGRRLWCQTLLTALKGEDGEVDGFSVVMRDVSERRMTSDQLRGLLTTDHLTGATNRARFFDNAATEVARWEKFQRPLALIMLDADHFKQVNDRYGHDNGDIVLQALVTRWQETVRSHDLVARLGGEEFAILVAGLEPERVMALCERLRRAICDAPIALDRTRITVTVSVGCALMGPGVEDLSSLMKAADLALYEAKQGGRNQSVMHAAEADAAVLLTRVGD